MKYVSIIITLIVLLTSCSGDKAAKTFERDKNIFVALTNGKEKQLTFNQSDSDPIFIADKNYVIFVRSQGSGYSQTKKIMRVNIDNLAESILTDQKSYKDSEGEMKIYSVNHLTLSLDKKSILFVTEKYVTSNQLVKVNLEDGKWTEMFSAENFEIIDKGEYKGYFLVAQNTIEDDYGRRVYYRLLNESGEIIKKFSDEESMRVFKNGLK